MANRPKEPCREEVVEDIAEKLVSYIGSGISVDPPVRDFDPNIEIEGLKDLLQYHFLLSGEATSPETTKRSQVDINSEQTKGITDVNGTPVGVRDFVSLLPQRLQVLDVELQQQTETFTGEVPGRVDWNQTVKQRYSSGAAANQVFVCKVQRPSMLTTRNQVLFELLTSIKQVYNKFDNQSRKTSKLKWFAPWFHPSDVPDDAESPDNSDELAGSDSLDPHIKYENLRPKVEQALSYRPFSRLDSDEISVSKIDLRQALFDRSALYREAAKLLKTYRDIVSDDLNEEQIKRFLNSQLFAPSNDTQTVSTLYELYWIFKLLDHFENPSRRPFSTIDDEDLVAAWEQGNHRYLLLNDWDGSISGKQYLEFRIPGPEQMRKAKEQQSIEDLEWVDSVGPSDRLTTRFGVVHRHHRSLQSDIEDRDHDELTPDIVLLKLDKTTEPPSLEDAFVAEVKHSTNPETIHKGFKQLLEYGSFAKIGSDLSIERETETEYLAGIPTVLSASELQLGYFVGHADVLSEHSFEDIMFHGYDETPNHPFSPSQ